MLTIFCSPKPFTKEANRNQKNALQSWKAIHPEVEIFMFGAPAGTKEVASELGAILVPKIECSPSGAPSFNAMEKYVSQNGRYDFQAYVNCDIILNPTFLKAMCKCGDRFRHYLMVGQRLDLSKGTRIDVCKADWLNSVEILAENGQVSTHGPTGVDYFGFVRGIWNQLPSVYMGRALCDPALLNYCLKRQIPIVNSTRSVLAIHQFHDYGHIPGGKQEVFFGEDRAVMADEHHLDHSVPIITDAPWMFEEHGNIVRGSQSKLRHWEFVIRYQHGLYYPSLLLRGLQYLGGKKNLQPKDMPASSLLAAWRRFLESN